MTTEKPLVGNTVERGSNFLSRPKTKLAWWSVALAGVFLFAILVLCSGVPRRLPGQPRWLGQPILAPICGLTMLVSGLTAGVTGLIAVLRHRERAWPIWFSLAVGALMLLFLLAELFGM